MTEKEIKFFNHEGLVYFKKRERGPIMGDHVQYMFRFKNNLGASVVKGLGCYGFENDLWELAVIEFSEGDKWSVRDDTPITNDVLGWLDADEVIGILDEIEKL